MVGDGQEKRHLGLDSRNNAGGHGTHRLWSEGRASVARNFGRFRHPQRHCPHEQFTPVDINNGSHVPAQFECHEH
jgi:hypothetical protein